ncbi:MAG: glucosamine-6-phosphate deaminase [Acidimicrobiia bacterium]|nr:glucosamine-6-phosphate deaminase [Acidimicrobiia bacterium]
MAGALRRFVENKPGARICLPTGATPRPAYHRFAGDRGTLSSATIYLLDEFGLPPGSPSRCDEMIARDLLDRLEVPPGSFHALDVGAGDLEAECARYEASVRAGGLDLAVLGLGGNGHLGLNEPGSDRTSVTRVVSLTPETSEHSTDYGSDQAATWGMTMGIDTLLSAAEIWLLVTGSHKAAILRRTLSDPIGPDVPSTFLRLHDAVTIYADQAAAARL